MLGFLICSDRYAMNYRSVSWSAWLVGWIMRRNFKEFYAESRQSTITCHIGINYEELQRFDWSIYP